MNPTNMLFWRSYTTLYLVLTTGLARANEKLTRREGQDFLEYIVIVGFALLVVAAIGALYAAINGLFERAAAAVGGLHF